MRWSFIIIALMLRHYCPTVAMRPLHNSQTRSGIDILVIRVPPTLQWLSLPLQARGTNRVAID